MPSFPRTRLRRTRQAEWSRALVRETILRPSDLILPLFVLDSPTGREPVASLPGVERLGVQPLIEQVKKAEALGIPLVALFPCVNADVKTTDAREAYSPKSLAARAIQAVKQACPTMGVMCDVALDLYTAEGHDGLLIDGQIANDETVEVLVKQALLYAELGCDVLGPSDMMDGRIGSIRDALEAQRLHTTQIMAYSAKYASALYGPYRDAVGSAGQLKGASKSTYQQDPANSDEALREAQLDVEEGADWLMVKPGTFYLDIIQRLREQTALPISAYQVSGEYAMIQAAAQQGWIDGERVMDEALLSLKRAGASAILSYGALESASRLLNN